MPPPKKLVSNFWGSVQFAGVFLFLHVGFLALDEGIKIDAVVSTISKSTELLIINQLYCKNTKAVLFFV